MCDGGDGLGYARRRLEEWGAWCHAGGGTPDLGYPHRANFVQVVRGLCAACGEDAAAESVERAMGRLKVVVPKSYAVLLQRYYYGDGMRQAAARLGVSEKTAKVREEVGVAYVAGLLEEMVEKSLDRVPEKV